MRVNIPSACQEIWREQKWATIRALGLVVAVTLVVTQRAPWLSPLSTNLAAIQLVKSGISLTWTMNWFWNADGRLALEGDAKDAHPPSPESDQAAAQRLRDSLWASAFVSHEANSSRILAYLDFAVGDYSGLQEHLTALASEGKQRPWDALALVKYYEWKGEHGLALEELRRGGTIDYPLFVAGRALEDGNVDSSLHLAELAYEAMPDSPKADNFLGHILVVYGTDQQSVQKALEVLGRGVQLEPGNANMQINLAHALVKAGRYDEALVHLRVADSQQPHDSIVHLLLGEVFLNQGNLVEAVHEYSASLDLHPKQVWALYGLGRVYAAQGRMPDAIAAWRTALQIDPGFEPAANALNSNK